MPTMQCQETGTMHLFETTIDRISRGAPRNDSTKASRKGRTDPYDTVLYIQRGIHRMMTASLMANRLAPPLNIWGLPEPSRLNKSWCCPCKKSLSIIHVSHPAIKTRFHFGYLFPKVQNITYCTLNYCTFTAQTGYAQY